MTEEQEYLCKVRQAQDDSWEEGYFAGRDGDPREVPETAWPSQWLIGYDAAVEDKQKKKSHPADTPGGQ